MGFSERPVGERFMEHFNSAGSKWTTMHRPLQVLRIYDGGKQKEDEITLEMMDRYGWWNVRGGRWCQVEMNSCPPALLEWQRLKMPSILNRGGLQGCARCGRDSHELSKCYARRDVAGQVILDGATVSAYSNSKIKPEPVEDYAFVNLVSSQSTNGSIDTEELALEGCFRCGRDSHWAKDCVAKTGYRLSKPVQVISDTPPETVMSTSVTRKRLEVSYSPISSSSSGRSIFGNQVRNESETTDSSPPLHTFGRNIFRNNPSSGSSSFSDRHGREIRRNRSASYQAVRAAEKRRRL